ncbi:MAG TPA: restriction endonuclease [Candidatus Methanoperedens sp.]|nr:restriction endonuclease [Candidatus Methanoperedens sp.]HLB70536.1 restriction endonuclease [Candidatus Methanoperedens sp.]
MENTFHYPPELLSLLIETLTRLCRSKKDLLLFFQGAGVSQSLLSTYEVLLKTNSGAFKKPIVTREILTKLNENGDRSLRERREIVKRVTEFQDFSVCWENDRAAARGYVAQVRELVHVKDSFTRMQIERDEEHRKRLDEQTARFNAEKDRKVKIEMVKADFYALFGDHDARKRGKKLEGVLNSLFAAYGILVKEAFTVKGACSEGVIEQIDGLVELDSYLYLVELKWWSEPIGTADVAPHLVRVYGRGGQARGIFISYSEYTAPAITACREALAGGAVVILCKLQEIVDLFEKEGDLKKWLKDKVTAAIVDRNPFYLQQ